MKKNLCLFENISKMSLGLVFLAISVGLVLSGFTIFPIFGFLFALPVGLVSLYFFRAHLNKECQIE